ncbi:hypothetical protein Ae201684P_004098 [Aphanomyces euteiches]|uniref:Uncharacterized protein n=1 Tax=Aphanomyces euteiches TaxID=100861 RepID=A0A6G0XU93_9STRA|nr:hypothetical protein Ae201684_001589 [Aphanomyces euteiches]KAH9075418.1 hypothetical protein Ae201684P_004098 [Aphanomyces euteiches]KAH9143725.1 hypothetical protein AeRB84_012291 [Aphanomyces euteiches]
MEFASLSRDEQKRRLKEWNQKAKQLKRTSSLTPPTTTATTDSVDTYLRTPSPVFNGNQVMPPNPICTSVALTSVSAIQAAYRNRSKEDEKKRVLLVKKSQAYQAWNQRRQDQANQMIFNNTLGVDDKEDTSSLTDEDQEDANPPQESTSPTFRLRNLSYKALKSEPGLKTQALAQICSVLLAGRPVYLESSARETLDTISDARLLIQQLCIESLLFCDRSQDLVPRIDDDVVSITLVPKSCF